jgi:hypothetical protein
MCQAWQMLVCASFVLHMEHSSSCNNFAVLLNGRSGIWKIIALDEPDCALKLLKRQQAGMVLRMNRVAIGFHHTCAFLRISASQALCEWPVASARKPVEQQSRQMWRRVGFN